MQKQLRRLYRSGAHNPQLACFLWEKCKSAKFEYSEEWDIKEFVAFCALECEAFSLASVLINSISTRFPGSERAVRLSGMQLEAKGKKSQAMEIYNHYLSRKPNSQLIMKRQIAIAGSEGFYSVCGDSSGSVALREACTLLTKYLEVYLTDAEAWMQGAHYYLLGLDYTKTLQCVDEALLIHPNAAPLWTFAGEIAYSANDEDLSRKQTCQAIDLTSGSSLRPLLNICTLCSNSKSVRETTLKSNRKLHSLCSAKALLLMKNDSLEKKIAQLLFEKQTQQLAKQEDNEKEDEKETDKEKEKEKEKDNTLQQRHKKRNNQSKR